MKTSLLIGLIFYCCIFAPINLLLSQTIISEDITTNTTWDTIGNPYILTNNVSIASGITLTINPGVKIAIPYLKNIYINGTLIAKGTDEDSIRFYGSDPDSSRHGGTIFFYTNNDTSFLDHVVIDNLGESAGGNDASIVIFSSSVTISNSRISGSERNGIHVNGNISPHIINNKIENNVNAGIYIPTISQPVINGNTFINNTKNILIHPESVGLTTITNNNLSVVSIIGTTINGVTSWPLNNEWTYELDGHLAIADGAKLTLAPGVEVGIPYSKLIQVSGTLIAKGTDEDSIRFYGSDPDSSRHGGTIFFYTNNDTSFLDHVVIDNLGESAGGNDASIVIFSSSVTISNSRISGSERNGIHIDGNISPTINNCIINNNKQSGIVCLNEAYPNITDNKIENNEIAGIYIPVVSQPIIDENTFVNNTKNILIHPESVGLSTITNNNISIINIIGTTINGVAIWPFSNEWSYELDGHLIVGIGATLTIAPGVKVGIPYSKNIHVRGTLMANGTAQDSIWFYSSDADSSHHGGTIYFYDSSKNSILNYVVAENLGESTTGNDACVSIYSSDVVISNSRITMSERNGIHVEGNISPEINDCNIIDNSLNGILCLSGAAPNIQFNRIAENNVGISIQNSQPKIKFNHFNSNLQYDLENRSIQNIDASQNYWDHVTTTEMEMSPYPSNINVIYDFWDNNSFGKIEYANWLYNEPSIFSVTPNRVASYGLQELIIRGNGFDVGTNVVLEKNGYQSIFPLTTTFVDSSKIIATFNFDGRPIGSWNVKLVSKDNQILELKDGLIIGDGYSKLWIEVNGRTSVRAGHPQSFTIQCGNSGNISVNRALIRLIVTNSFLNTPLPSSFEDKIEPFKLDTLYFIILDIEPGQNHYLPISIFSENRGEIIGLQAQIYDASTLFNQRAINYNLNHINKFQRISQVQLKHLPGYIVNLNQIPTNDMDGALLINTSYTSHAATLLHYPNGWFVGENLTQDKNGFSGYRLTPWEKYVERNKNNGVYAVNIPMNNVQKEKLKNWAVIKSKDPSAYYDYINWKCTDAVREGYIYAGIDYFPDVDPITTPMELFYKLTGYLPEDIPQLVRDIEIGVSCLPSSWIPLKLWVEYAIHERYGIKSNNIISNLLVVGSFDPNEKVGPNGYTINNFITIDQPFQYIIYFENVDSATAAAQEIDISDTLDNNLDWNTLSFGDAQIGDTTIIVGNITKSLSKIIPWNDTTVVHFEGTFNLDSGIVYWHLKGIDNRTGELSDFLLPNKIPPEGEGFVSLNIKPKQNLVTGSDIKNKASIIFDINPPIQTNEVINAIDADIPQSSIISLPDSMNTQDFDVTWAGNDVGSGIRNYSIFVSENGGPYSEWLNNVSDTTAVFSGQVDNEYAFYSIAIDSVGNRELTPLSPDVITNIITSINSNSETLPKKYLLYQNFPNPFNPYTTIKYSVPHTSFVNIKIYDILGREVKTLVNEEKVAGNYTIKFNGSNFASGVYFYRMHANNFYQTKKFILLK